FLALGSIILGSALTMKIQYYKLVYAAEASFGKALITALVDLHILPEGMRRLEAI
ncbi:MAG: YeeE/YedE family protein, partial [Ketobacter sp.]|nr:YeeE/YedE family protein [Ketobacter sp.]